MADQTRSNDGVNLDATSNTGSTPNTETTGREGEVRHANPANAAQDPENAARQEQVRRDRDALEAQADRVEATTPAEARDRTVGEIVDDAERRSGVDLRNP